MAIPDVSAVFIDTNVLVYFDVKEAPLHRAARKTLSEWRAQGTPSWISRQVLREYLATLTRPQMFSSPLPMDSVLERVAHFERRFTIAEDGPTVTGRLYELLRQLPVGGNQIHDANIVATMLAHDIPCILTHNIADFARFSEVITVLPLQEASLA